MPGDRYLFPGTAVLKNKLGIRDADQLQAIEFQETALRAPDALEYARRRGTLDEPSWRGIHRILFRNVYSGAGKLRTVELSKGGTAFAPVRAPSGYADRHILPAFRVTATDAGSDDRKFAAALAECWGELNFLHPFREGNGRATQFFVMALAQWHGRTIDWRKVDRAAEIAAAQAAANKNYQPYADLLAEVMEPWPPGGRDRSPVD